MVSDGFNGLSSLKKVGCMLHCYELMEHLKQYGQIVNEYPGGW